MLALAAVGVSGGLGLMAAGPLTMAPAAQQTLVQVAQAAEPDQATLMREGTALYARQCAVCHGAAGQGGDGPKLAGNEFVKNAGGVVSQILNGAEEHGMPPFASVLNDREIAAVSTFVRNSFGNSAGIVSVATAASMRGTR
jgi:aldose sugar dehydrogenase